MSDELGPFATALDTCFRYLSDNLGTEENVSCWKDSEPPIPGSEEFSLNVWSFICTGGPANERPNFSQAKGAGPWRTTGIMIGQYENMAGAAGLVDDIMGIFPAAGDQSHLDPNVTTFRVATQPSLYSRYMECIDDEGTFIKVYFVEIQFDVIYSKCTT